MIYHLIPCKVRQHICCAILMLNGFDARREIEWELYLKNSKGTSYRLITIEAFEISNLYKFVFIHMCKYIKLFSIFFLILYLDLIYFLGIPSSSTVWPAGYAQQIHYYFCISFKKYFSVCGWVCAGVCALSIALGVWAWHGEGASEVQTAAKRRKYIHKQNEPNRSDSL